MIRHIEPSPETIREIVSAAMAAPSSHNTQPWLFRPTAKGLDLLADRTRGLPVNDPYDRELTISCGAALHNLEVAAHHLGLSPETALLPDPADHDLLATISFTGGPSSAVAIPDGFDALTQRRTTRGPLTAPDEPGALTGLVAPSTHGVTFTAIERHQRDQIAELVADGDRAQFADPRWRRELASWMHPRRRGDGLVVPEVVGLATRVAVSAFDLGKTTAGKDADLAHGAPLLILVTTEADDPETWLRTGQALQRFLLAAARLGLAVGYLNQPCQVPEIRTRLQQVAPTPGFPQLLLRVGTAPDQGRATPRRPIDDVLLEAADAQ
jgi:hypothetical protein